MIVLFTTTVLSVFATAIMVTKAASTKKTATKSKKGSPRKDLTKITMRGKKTKWKAQYFMKVMKLKCDIELIWAEKNASNDAYLYPVHKMVDEEDMWREHGILQTARRRTSKEDNDAQTNDVDGFPRKVLIRLVEESTPESRTEMLEIIQEYMSHTENNKYGYEYIINDSSDLTPENDDDLETADNYLQDQTIVDFIESVYESTDTNWFESNQEEAMTYFSEPYPMNAVEELGYPATL